MKKQILIILTAILLIATPAFAAKDATESAAEEIKEKIKERLEKTANEGNEDKEKEENNASENTNTAKYHAWVGNLVKIENNTLYITTDEGEKQAEIDGEAIILQTEKGKSRKEVDAEDLLEGNFILAMGTLKDDIIIAKRIISTPPAPDQPEKTLVYGKVSEIDDKAIKLSNGRQNTLPVDEDKTGLFIKGVKKPKFVDIQLEDKLYAITIIENDEIKETFSIFVIPGKYNPENDQNKAEEEATSSAKPEQTSSVESPESTSSAGE